jgi:hypothetical protein
MSVGNIIIIVAIGIIIGIAWTIQNAESCMDILINAVLVIIAGILVIGLFVLVVQYSGH